MTLYKKKPEEYEAIRFTEINVQECLDFIRSHDKHGSADYNSGTCQIQLFNTYGVNYVNIGHWLVVEKTEGIVDDYSDDEFQSTFTKVGDGDATI